ncbi:unnamed protein product [Arabidopsis lyrata]|nr:unnamed protein product [Arabidopsis lyrata]
MDEEEAERRIYRQRHRGGESTWERRSSDAETPAKLEIWSLKRNNE